MSQSAKRRYILQNVPIQQRCFAHPLPTPVKRGPKQLSKRAHYNLVCTLKKRNRTKKTKTRKRKQKYIEQGFPQERTVVYRRIEISTNFPEMARKGFFEHGTVQSGIERDYLDGNQLRV